MTIIPDLETAIVMTIPFLVTYAALHFILFRPLFAYLDDREQAIDGARDEAARLAEQVEAQADTLQERVSEARKEVTNLHAEARTRALKEEATILAEARAQADARISEALVSIRSAQTAASGTMKTAAEQLSTDIAGQILGREIQA